MCINNGVHLFAGKNMLVTPILADLISTLSEENVEVQKDGNKLLFSTSNIVVFGAELDGIDQYPDVSGINEIEYPYTVKLNKSELESALDRLELFADPFDNHAVRLEFTKAGLKVSDLKCQSFEEHKFVDGSSPIAPDEPLDYLVNVGFFQDLLGSLSSEAIDVSFAPGGAPIKIVDGNIIEVICPMEEPAQPVEEGAE
jgi:DNA polymerase III sliding clamp (beta) subunit (PCNA family)